MNEFGALSSKYSLIGQKKEDKSIKGRRQEKKICSFFVDNNSIKKAQQLFLWQKKSHVKLFYLLPSHFLEGAASIVNGNIINGNIVNEVLKWGTKNKI